MLHPFHGGDNLANRRIDINEDKGGDNDDEQPNGADGGEERRVATGFLKVFGIFQGDLQGKDAENLLLGIVTAVTF
jgi:hypothetical protein